jgi:ABC-2 type transport system ATP-binding protein
MTPRRPGFAARYAIMQVKKRGYAFMVFDAGQGGQSSTDGDVDASTPADRETQQVLVSEPPAPEQVSQEPPLPTVYSIVAEGLSKRFGKKLAVESVTLRVGQGEFFGFLGPNGAGKSTTIRMLCGLLRPDAGHIEVAGIDLMADPLGVKRSIGVLPEETNLYERLTGEEFLMFAGQMYGLSRDETHARAESLLDLMELTEDRRKLIVDYSMGMRKKVALASAMIHRPKVLFLDEPFNGIDPISVRAIRNVMRHLIERGATIFITSHVMEVIERLCTRVAIINQGRIVGEGTLAQLRSMAHADSVTSLEDVFLTLVDARAEPETLNWL